MKLWPKKDRGQGARQRRHDQVSTQQANLSRRSNRWRAEEAGPNTGRKLWRGGGAKASAWQNFWLQRFGLIVLLICTLLAATNTLSLSSNPKVLPLTSDYSGLFLRDTGLYEAAAQGFLTRSIWNHNKITVDTGGLSRELTQQFPELAAVSITLPLLSHRPLVYIQPAQAALILKTSNGSFVVDDRGKALLATDRLKQSAALKLPQVTDQSGLSAQLGRQVLSTKDVSFIQTVVAELAARHIAVSAMTLPTGTSELDATVSGQPYTVKFNLHSDTARQQAGTYLATATYIQRKNITPAQYIDVRVEGRAYYK